MSDKKQIDDPDVLAAIASAVSGIFPDAPSDGSQYARQDGDWEVVSGGGGGAANAMTYEGSWDASSGSFPSGADLGEFYYVSVAGTVDSVDFAIGDRLIAITNSASTSVYAANWEKLDATDAVTTVVGQVGNVTAAQIATAIDGESDTNLLTDAERGKIANISVTQAVDLDAIESAAVPSGGTTNQVLSKASGTNYDMQWVDPSGGSDEISGTDTPPVSPSTYEVWIDSSTGQMFYWDGTFWVETAGSAPEFDPTAYDLSEFGGFVDVGQGGFGFSIDSVDGDPAGALALLGGATSGHAHNITWEEVTSTTYTLSPSDVGKTLLFNITGNAACTVTLPNQATESGWLEGRSIGMLAYSSGTITISPAASVNVDGVTATTFDLVQHGLCSLTRLPANNFWNFSGQVA